MLTRSSPMRRLSGPTSLRHRLVCSASKAGRTMPPFSTRAVGTSWTTVSAGFAVRLHLFFSSLMKRWSRSIALSTGARSGPSGPSARRIADPESDSSLAMRMSLTLSRILGQSRRTTVLSCSVAAVSVPACRRKNSLPVAGIRVASTRGSSSGAASSSVAFSSIGG